MSNTAAICIITSVFIWKFIYGLLLPHVCEFLTIKFILCRQCRAECVTGMLRQLNSELSASGSLGRSPPCPHHCHATPTGSMHARTQRHTHTVWFWSDGACRCYQIWSIMTRKQNIFLNIKLYDCIIITYQEMRFLIGGDSRPSPVHWHCVNEQGSVFPKCVKMFPKTRCHFSCSCC